MTSPTNHTSPRHARSTMFVVTAGLLLLGCGSDTGQDVGTAAAPISSPPASTQASTAAPTSVPTTLDAAVVMPVIADHDPRYLFTIVTGAGGGVLLTRLDGTDQLRLAPDVPGVHKHASWSPDGEHVVFVDEQSENVWIAHLDGSPSTQIHACDTGGCDYPAFSPDGAKLAYSRWQNGPAGSVGPAAVGIYVFDLATGAESEVVSLSRPELADVPRWSPDGTSLVIGVDQIDDTGAETGAAIAVVPAGGGEPVYLTDFSMYAYAPDWNLQTGEIVFGPTIRDAAADFSEDETWDAWAIQPDGTGLRQVTHADPGERIKGAKWTPDGSAILALSTTRGMVSIDPTTGEMTAIANVPPNTTSPKLRPTP